MVGNPLFVRWANLIGLQNWLGDPRFATDATRGEHAELISARMQEWTGERTTEQVMEELDAARIPCGEVLTPQQALEHEQVHAMQYLQNMQYPGLDGDYPLPRTPIEFSKSASGVPVRPPLLGEHTDSILIELGFSAAEIAQLHADHVV